jgi:hypothetical protein
MTPSFPTLSIASAMSLPSRIVVCGDGRDLPISAGVLISFDIFLSSAMTVCTARSMPRFSIIGFAPPRRGGAPAA